MVERYLQPYHQHRIITNKLVHLNVVDALLSPNYGIVIKAAPKITTVAPNKQMYKPITVKLSGTNSVEFLFMNTRTALGIRANQVTAWNKHAPSETKFNRITIGLPTKLCTHHKYGAADSTVGSGELRSHSANMKRPKINSTATKSAKNEVPSRSI